MGEHAAGEITRLWAQLRDQARNPPGEGYLAGVGQLNALRKQAEEVVLADLILLPPEPGTSDEDPARRHSRDAGRTLLLPPGPGPSPAPG